LSDLGAEERRVISKWTN